MQNNAAESTFSDKPLEMRTLFQIGRTYALPQWKWYMGGIVALIVTNIIMLEIPQMAKKIVNVIAASEPLGEYTWLAAGIVGLGFLLVFIRTISRVFIFWPGRTLEAAVKDDVFSHILRVPSNLIARFGLGDLTSRLSNDVTQLRVFFAFGALQVLNVICMMTFTIAKMASINGILTILTVTPLVVMLVITRFVMPILYKAMRDATEATGRLTNRVTEAFVHVNVIQASCAVDAFVDRTAVESQNIYDANMRTVKLRNFIFPLMTIMAGLSEFAILTWGGSEVLANRLSIGDLMAFNIYIGILIFPFTSIGLILAVYQRAKPAAERLGEVAALKAESDRSTVTMANLASEISRQKSNKPIISIKNLNYEFTANRPVLQNINLEITPGKRIGIFGSIGSGKSTLFHLLTRLYDPQPGQIFLHGHDVLAYSPREVRSFIAFARQTPLLFSETIRDNLLLGFEEGSVSQAQLEDAAARAQILSEIKRFPDGWDTVVGENGVRLSGGQKQRLALARLLLRKAEVYILDDVLSAVDHDTEHRLIETLLATQATLLIASHRSSILEPCDEILVLDQGKLIGRGRFKEVESLIRVKERERESSEGGPA